MQEARQRITYNRAVELRELAAEGVRTFVMKDSLPMVGEIVQIAGFTNPMPKGASGNICVRWAEGVESWEMRVDLWEILL